jgi:hypothetical protein
MLSFVLASTFGPQKHKQKRKQTQPKGQLLMLDTASHALELLPNPARQGK